MQSKTLRAVFAPICSLFLLTQTIFATACFPFSALTSASYEDFHYAVSQSKIYLDELGDDIYDYWYDAIYNDTHNGDIDEAILAAQTDNLEGLYFLEENEEEIHVLYKSLKDSDLAYEVDEVMVAYSNYYEFVVNVSGSFETYSASYQPLKNQLASALKKFSLAI